MKLASATWPREPALEQAIIDAPLDPVPRMVYADWLQAHGDRRGEWMAINAAIEAEPANVRLRSAAVDFLGGNLDLLLGPGKALLVGGWIGWRAGFIDELRVQPIDHKEVVKPLASLLAHPSSRFVRTIGLGDLRQAAIDVLEAAELPLLETVVTVDKPYYVNNGHVVLDALAEVPTLRRLGLHGATVIRPMPQLRELTGKQGGTWRPWAEQGGCANLERLTLDCVRGGDAIAPLLRAVPRLKQLRLVGHDGTLEAVAELRELELLDLSYASITDSEVERFVGWPSLKLVAHRTRLSRAVIERLTKSGVDVVWSQGEGRLEDDQQPGSWLHERLRTEGRDALATLPGIGYALYNIGTRHSIDGDAIDATPLLDASLTFPNEGLKTWAWANAAIAHERRHRFDDAELIAREGLLRTPKEPNLYAIVIDALRRTGRLKEALAMLPRAMAAIDARPGPGAHTGGRPACFGDVLMVLAQAGKHDEVIRLAREYKELVKQRKDIYAIIAMSLVALGKLERARKASLDAEDSRFPAVVAHASAVVALADGEVEDSLEHLRRAKAASYPEWHWIATDPNLAALHGNPEFVALTAGEQATPSQRL